MHANLLLSLEANYIVPWRRVRHGLYNLTRQAPRHSLLGPAARVGEPTVRQELGTICAELITTAS